MSKRKPKGYPYVPDETVRKKGWTLKFYKTEGIATCHRDGTNVTYVITEQTDEINSLPQYVIDQLTKRIFLREWQRKKVDQSLARLSEISKKLEKMREKGEI